MRILGFSQRWEKLDDLVFTTFRVPRRDKDWQPLEHVQVWLKPRSKQREYLGIAEILAIEPRFMQSSRVVTGPVLATRKGLELYVVRDIEARRDGFGSGTDMRLALEKMHRRYDFFAQPVNKLTLVWLEKVRT